MLNTLETIEKMDIQVPRKAGKVAESRNGKGKMKVAFKDNSTFPNKKHSSRHCALCAKHGGAKLAHDTVDCQRYEKDGVSKMTFKSQKGKSPDNTKIDRESFKTMEDNLKKVRIELTKTKKGSRKSKKM